MVVLVAGGRNFSNKEQVFRVLDVVLSWSKDGHVTIVTGDSGNADHFAMLWAIERGEKHREFPVAKDKATAQAIGAVFDWETHGKSAGPYRNQHMIETTNPDQGVIFDGEDGTLDTLTRLFARGVNTWVVGKGI